MRLFHASSAKILSAGCALLLVCSLASGQTSAKSSTQKTASKSSSTHKSKHSKKSSKKGQQKIDAQRATEIQEALIREHYLDGKATGKWDQASQDAMEKFQADNGWQSKVVPDSRALIKLGLGPDHQHLLNPESAMTTAPTIHPAAATQDAPSGNPQR